MNDSVDVREAGDGALLLRCPAVIDVDVNARVVAIGADIRAQRLRGVRDVVPTFHTVAVHFDPLRGDVDQIAAALRSAATVASKPIAGRHHEVPVSYGGNDGPDLDIVAARAGITAADAIRRHSSGSYRVFMLGFQPGFAYLGLVDPLLATPRHDSPRLAVPAGSVGIAGRQTGIYPAASPGGWHIVGRALEPVFDSERGSPRFAPGDTVTFVSAHAGTTTVAAGRVPPQQPHEGRRVTLLKPGLFTTVQDGGRWGRQHEGFPVSGAMDVVSHAIANAVVGNAPDAAALEVTLAGPELRVEQATTVAVAGAELSAALDGIAIPHATPVAARAGSLLQFGAARRGMRAYVAFEGGISHSGGWPPARLKAGDTIGLNACSAERVAVTVPMNRQVFSAGRLRVLPGPHRDLLPPNCLDALLHSRFTVSGQSNRVGYRLSGATVPSTAAEMISDATFAGGIQIPPSGEPILLMADRQTTGGYPQIATVITADLPAAAQLRPGDEVGFTACSRAEAVAALAAQQAWLRDVR